VLALKGVVVRLGGLYGDDRQLNKESRLDSPLNIIYRVDAVGVLETIIATDCHSEIFNAVSDEHRSKSEILKQVQDDRLVENGIRVDKVVSNAKLKRVLGYTFVYPTVLEI
jgi:hypothetical protein